jgi:hypothetical protein
MEGTLYDCMDGVNVVNVDCMAYTGADSRRDEIIVPIEVDLPFQNTQLEIAGLNIVDKSHGQFCPHSWGKYRFQPLAVRTVKGYTRDISSLDEFGIEERGKPGFGAVG